MSVSQQPVDAVILAGGRNTIPLYEGYQPGYKALIEIAGQPCLRHVLNALRGNPCIRRIGVVGEEAVLKPIVGDDVDAFSPPEETLLGSVIQAWSLFPDASMVLTTVADLPMLKPTMVEEFLEACSRTSTTYQEKAFLAVVSKERFTGVFERAHKDMSAFRGVTVCHGNLVLASPRILQNQRAMSRLNAMYAARKNAIKCALAIGVGLGLAYVVGVHCLHVLTLERMTELASRRFGFGIVPVQLSCPEVCLDVDEAADYQLARECMEAGEVRVGVG